MKLYSIHCGFYDEELSDGIYEFHLNLYVVAENIVEAKVAARKNSDFIKKKMHIDGVQEIEIINGYKIEPQPLHSQIQQQINDFAHRDL